MKHAPSPTGGSGTPRTLLILGAGGYYTRVIREVQALGYRTVAVDRNPQAPGFALADAHAAVDIVDRAGVLGVARDHAVDGIMPVNDFGVRTAAFVAGELGLAGIGADAAEAANDKGLMRERWRSAGLAIPDFQVVATLEEARRAAGALGYPLVLKPTDCGGGGRGISVVRCEEDLEWAYELARPFVKNDRLIIEQFLDGVEMTVESVSHRGEVHVLAASDKVKAPLRTRVATSLTFPADLSDDVLRDVYDLVRGAVRAVGIHDGPAHTEVIVTADGPKLVEIGARGGGGHIFSTIVHAVSGVNMVQESARIFVGDEPNLRPTRQHGCVYRFFTPPAGILRGVSGIEEARRLPGVLDVGVFKQPGDRVGELVNSLERAGFMVVEGASRAEAQARADAVERTIAFDVIPDADAQPPTGNHFTLAGNR